MQLDAIQLARVEALLAGGRRSILGLVGPPGCGKSTLAQALVTTFPRQIQVVPMDGFHLANAELQRLGRVGRKGAQDTFDSAGYVALLRRIKDPIRDETIYAPEFHRDIEEPVAGTIGVRSDTPLIVTEGNYLLLDQGPWAALRALLDEAWYIEVPDPLRRDWLLQRHMRFGRTAEQAREWIAHTDEPNARLIAATREHADLVVRIAASAEP
ncbi:MAG TPA: nucleoside/nucleotide kinase family protein [Albitalea sp.]|nr:nucleoside/nucleotide kinase family protein [Albitalea sp.]